VEDYLAQIPADLRQTAVVEALLLLEVELREARGDVPAAEEYLQRLPGYEPLIRRHFQLREALGRDGLQATVARTTLGPAPGAETRTDSPPSTQPAAPSALAAAGCASVPGYDILGVLGRGGMGVVYKARQHGLNRTVALKMILAGGHAGEAELARFRAEAEAVARLQHANIVAVHEVRDHDTGPFFSMEYVAGGSLAGRLAGTPLPPDQAAALVETLARAVDAAHQRGVVHRDLKPANVLLAEDGTPKISDFGLAKRLDTDAGQTHTGAVMGTPSYMAPEQAEGRTREVGPAADVYALGAILYECLTGRPPFKAATLMETLEQVRTQEPVPPAQLQRGVPRDLETICLKCLHKEAHKRYSSASELAEDLRRQRSGEPIRARPVGRLEQLGKWARRHPGVARLVVLVVLVTLTGLALVGWFYRQAVDKAVQAEQARDAERDAKIDANAKAERARIKEIEAKNALEGEKEANVRKEEALTREKAAKQEIEVQLDRSERAVSANKVKQAYQLWAGNNVTLADALLEECRWDMRGWDWCYLRRLFNPEQGNITAYSGEIAGVAFSPGDGLLAVAGSRSSGERMRLMGVLPRSAGGGGFVGATGEAPGGGPQVIDLWDTQTGSLKANIRCPANGLRDLAFARNGELLAACYPGQSPLPGIPRQGSLPGLIQVWDRTSNQMMTLRGPIERLAISRDGRFLALRPHNQVSHFDLAARKFTHTLPLVAGPAGPLAYSPDGKYLAVVVLPAGKQVPTEVRLWEPAEKKESVLLGSHDDAILALAYSADGKRLATAGKDRVIKVWDVAARTQVGRMVGHAVAVTDLAFSPDGKTLVSTSGDRDSGDTGRDGELKTWDVKTGREVSQIRGRANGFYRLAISPDGKRLATGCGNGRVKVWDAAASPEATVVPTTAQVMCLAVSPDGKLVACGSAKEAALGEYDIRVYDARTLAERHRFRAVHTHVFNLAFSPDNKRLFATVSERIGQSAAFRTAVWAWSLQTGEQVKALPFQDTVDVSACLVMSPDGTRLLTGNRLWDVTSGKVVADTAAKNQIVGAEFTRDGRRLVLIRYDRYDVLDSQTGKELFSFKQPGGNPGIALSPDGKLLALPTARGPMLLHLESGKEALSLMTSPDRPDSPTTCVTFTPDGKRLVSGTAGGRIIFHELVGGQEVLTLQAHRLGANSLAFSPDGKRLFTGGWDRTLKVWDALPWPPRTLQKSSDGFLARMNSLPGPVDPVLLDPAGRFLATANGNTTRIWDMRTGKEIQSLPGGQSNVEALAADRQGKRLVTVSQKRWVEYADPRNGPQRLFAGQLDRGPDSKDLFRKSADQVIRVWDTQTWQKVLELKADGALKPSAAFHPDGRRLAVACRREVLVWDADGGKKLLTLRGHTQDVTAVAFSPDGRLLLSGAWEQADSSADGSELKLWDAETGQPRGSLPTAPGRVLSVAFSPDGKLVAAALGDAPGKERPGQVRLWEVESGRELHRLKGHSGAVTTLAFSPNGKLLMTGSHDRTVKIWDVASGKVIHQLSGYSDVVTGVAYGQDGKHIATTSPNELMVWDANLWRSD
jgi:WD40 repeat protein